MFSINIVRTIILAELLCIPIKEKTIAARRAKISELVFPADNQEDFEDLDESVREGITAHFVKKLEDVLAIGFPNLKWKQRIKK